MFTEGRSLSTYSHARSMAASGALRHEILQLIQNSRIISRALSIHRYGQKSYESFGEAVKPKTLEPAEQTPTSDSTGKHKALESRILSEGLSTGDNRSKAERKPKAAPDTCEDLEFGKSITVDARRVDPTTVKQVYYFDSLSIVKSLETKGFSREQAEGLAESWTEIINTTLDHQSRHMITKKQQEITVQQLMAEIVSVKKDMVLLQKSEFSQLRSETEKMAIELNNLRKSFVDEVNKLKGHVTLDINLERGRSVEAHATNAGKLQELGSKMDTDIANLKTTFEQYRNDVLKFAGGTVLTCATLCMGIIRLWY